MYNNFIQNTSTNTHSDWSNLSTLDLNTEKNKIINSIKSMNLPDNLQTMNSEGIKERAYNLFPKSNINSNTNDEYNGHFTQKIFKDAGLDEQQTQHLMDKLNSISRKLQTSTDNNSIMKTQVGGIDNNSSSSYVEELDSDTLSEMKSSDDILPLSDSDVDSPRKSKNNVYEMNLCLSIKVY